MQCNRQLATKLELGMDNEAEANCGDCKRATAVVFDCAAGDTVCSECGLVLESRDADETSVWRMFANGNDSSSRVGGPSNPLPSSNGRLLSTATTRTGRRSNPDSSLVSALKIIATMSDRLELVATIKDCASEIYKKVEDRKAARGRSQEAISAACIYIACRQENKPRTVREICSVANGATMKEIARAKERIIKQLELEVGQSVEIETKHAAEFTRRFCSKLEMPHQTVKAAQEAVQKTEELDIRRTPTSVIAAIIYIVAQLSDDKKSLKDISHITRVAPATLRNSFKDLYPHLSKIVPRWFAQEEDLKNLQVPVVGRKEKEN